MAEEQENHSHLRLYGGFVVGALVKSKMKEITTK